MVRELLDLEAALHDPARSGTRDALGTLVDAAQALRQELSAMLDDPLYASLPEAWHGLGMVSRLLDRPEESERAFVEACRLAPFQIESWLGLTRVRGERGDHAGAETAARRAVEVDPGRSEPWANLAMTLALQRRLEECRDAVRRALEIDPDDHVAVHLRRHLDAQRDG
jgi:tetratricopeptide (TPR) repeat protein